MAEYVVAVDAMGGDDAPEAICAGAVKALSAFSDLRVSLFGPLKTLKRLTGEAGAVLNRLDLYDAPDVIDIHEAPMLAVRRKVDSSLVQAALAVKEGRAQALVSAGPTGAVLASGILRIGRIRGIERPALAPVLPGRKKPFLLIDCGANVDCQAPYLLAFGLMGAVYMREMLGVKDPDVRLLNIGAEKEKGNKLAREAYDLMEKQTVYRFGGNVEGRDVPCGEHDVVVADGFDGNLILKYTEGLASALTGMLKDEMLSNTRSKIGALLLKPALKRFKGRMDYEAYGGAPLLGVKGAVIKAHGSSSDLAIMNAIRQARAMIEGDVAGRIERGIQSLTAKEPNEKGENTDV